MPELIADRYEVVATIRERAGRTLARALDLHHDPPVTVALKLVELRANRTRQEVVEEGRILMDLASHPGIPKFWHSFFDGDRYVLVMEWVDGIDLEQELQERGDPGLTLTTVLDYVRQAGAALDHLHAHDPSIVHGDVKPANLVRRRNGQVVLVDFGIARGAGVRSREGTLGYVAPEIVAGEVTSPAQDVYGLASTAVTLLTGRPPNDRRPDWGPIDPDEMPNLVLTLQRALELDPSKRPTAGDLAERLANSAATLPGGVITFLALEVNGADDLWERDAEAMDVVSQRVDSLAAAAAAELGGRIVSFASPRLAVFISAISAARCALALHQRVAAQTWPDDIDVRLRVALHTGEALIRDGRYVGPTPNQARRLFAAARPGTTSVSRATAELVHGHLPAGARVVPETMPASDHWVLLGPTDEDPEPITQPSAPPRRPRAHASPPEAVERAGAAADASGARRVLVDAVMDRLAEVRAAVQALEEATARTRSGAGTAPDAEADTRALDQAAARARSAHAALERAQAELAAHDAVDAVPPGA